MVRCLINHPMETGTRKDAKTGELIPAHFIKRVAAMVGGKTVLKAQWGPGISRNPYLAFKVKGAQRGDKVVISWEDNKGAKETAEACIR